jgi:hypothetical protein
VRNDLVTETKLEVGPYLELRRAWSEYARLREERARLKTLLSHQLYGVFPELRSVWTDLFAPGCLAVLRLGLSPHEIAALPVNDFIRRAHSGQFGHPVRLKSATWTGPNRPPVPAEFGHPEQSDASTVCSS